MYQTHNAPSVYRIASNAPIPAHVAHVTPIIFIISLNASKIVPLRNTPQLALAQVVSLTVRFAHQIQTAKLVWRGISSQAPHNVHLALQIASNVLIPAHATYV